jgi:lysozyme family protein
LIPFHKAFELTLEHEGLFTNDPADRGNWTGGAINSGELKGTKFGISAMTYSHLDIINLTQQEAKVIYKKDFWDASQLSDFEAVISILWFDAIVNSGKRNANKIMQRAIFVKDDGVVGPITRKAINGNDAKKVALMFLAERLNFYTRLPTFNDFGRGWVRRVTSQLQMVAKDELI